MKNAASPNRGCLVLKKVDTITIITFFFFLVLFFLFYNPHLKCGECYNLLILLVFMPPYVSALVYITATTSVDAPYCRAKRLV
jgi:hypothetical protein